MTNAGPSARSPHRRAPPLAGVLVLDMSQFLSGPSAALRLGDLGARVIKIERPEGGDICRSLYLTDTDIAGDSTLFHAINRNKESFAADLKNPDDLRAVRQLIRRADVLIQNFRPGVIERLGLGYDDVRSLNGRLIYASITGYGSEGTWADWPGQDLLAQALSGAMWLSGSAADGPVPFGLSVADMLAGHAITEGVLAALVRRGVTGEGALVETSLLEAVIDLQFEVLTTFLNDGGRQPSRSSFNNAHAYLAAPYGVYPTANGFLALAMTPLPKLGDILERPELGTYDAQAGFTRRDEIKRLIAAALSTRSTEDWLTRMRQADVWCAPVLDWPALTKTEGFRVLGMLQTISRGEDHPIDTTRSPIRIDGSRPICHRAAPRVGEHTQALRAEFELS